MAELNTTGLDVDLEDTLALIASKTKGAVNKEDESSSLQRSKPKATSIRAELNTTGFDVDEIGRAHV